MVARVDVLEDASETNERERLVGRRDVELRDELVQDNPVEVASEPSLTAQGLARSLRGYELGRRQYAPAADLGSYAPSRGRTRVKRRR